MNQNGFKSLVYIVGLIVIGIFLFRFAIRIFTLFLPLIVIGLVVWFGMKWLKNRR